MSMFAQMSWSQWFLAATLIGVCCFLVLVILLQRGRGGGLTGAFGGAGGSSAFGAKTGDVFTWITVVVATVFVVLATLANFGFDESAPPLASVVTPEETTPPTPMPTGGVTPDWVPGGLELGELVPAPGEPTDDAGPVAGDSDGGAVVDAPADQTAPPQDAKEGAETPVEVDEGNEEQPD